jgi:signal transduction histidine kinase/CheY-like chemotaxis protein
MKVDDRLRAPTALAIARRSRNPQIFEADLKNLALIAWVAVIYFASGKAGLYFASFSPSSTVVWPATGIAFSAMLLLGFRVWPAVFLGAFLVNVTTFGTAFTSLGIATGNTLEAVVAVCLTTRYANGRRLFEHPNDFFKFVATSMFAAAISATLGVASLAFGGFASHEAFARIWQTWWVGDVGGFLLFAPVIILWVENPSLIEDRRQRFEVWMTLSAISLIGFMVFGGILPGVGNYPVGFFCIPILVWSAFRFGQRETATAAFILAASADWGMKHGNGQWARFADPFRAIIIPQVFIMTMTVMTLAMAAVVWERKRAEAQANEARNQAEAANRAKDQFLAMLGHELRNPIGALSSALRALERGDVRSEQYARLQEIMIRQSGHLARMVDDLFDIGRLTSGHITLNRRPMNVGECARDCIATLRMRDDQVPHNMSIGIEDIWIDGDPDRFTQILNNLLSNALKFTSPEGKIVFNVGAEGDRAVIHVEDDGEGISPDLLPYVFDLFVQGDQGSDRRFGGLGIGLNLVRQLVELQGGTVEAHSNGRGSGSAFTVRIPRIEAIQKRPKRSRMHAVAETSRRILIVEDNADSREALREVLEQAGHEIFEAATGTEGVASALANHPDIALIDIGLPGIDGYEVSRRIRSALGADGMTLIALTGYGLPTDRWKSELAGFDAHLVKPLDFDQLTDLLMARVDGPDKIATG